MVLRREECVALPPAIKLQFSIPVHEQCRVNNRPDYHVLHDLRESIIDYAPRQSVEPGSSTKVFPLSDAPCSSPFRKA